MTIALAALAWLAAAFMLASILGRALRNSAAQYPLIEEEDNAEK